MEAILKQCQDLHASLTLALVDAKSKKEKAQKMIDLCFKRQEENAAFKKALDDRERILKDREIAAASVEDVVKMKKEGHALHDMVQKKENDLAADRRKFAQEIQAKEHIVEEARLFNVAEAKRLAEKEKTMEAALRDKIFKSLKITGVEAINAAT